MRKEKDRDGEVVVMESFSHMGMRTRAKTLAAMSETASKNNPTTPKTVVTKKRKNETSTCFLDCTQRREKTPSSSLRQESDEQESMERPTSVSRHRSMSEMKTPSEAEIDEFFSTAEKDEQRRFTDKFNFDIRKDLPLKGRYEWYYFGVIGEMKINMDLGRKEEGARFILEKGKRQVTTQKREIIEQETKDARGDVLQWWVRTCRREEFTVCIGSGAQLDVW
ncbi:hypothetical protein IFM89_031911 [Coptis chinensis]|uniref:Cyclin-dependent kinase inhibitor domain-containing protein n=1 Tax=Coptis chinensis TaxID=261450 RepID=A0A835MAJ3_9MAGN|nr:hypothetical protein IFM89_031911 [Coptis chinensis]